MLKLLITLFPSQFAFFSLLCRCDIVYCACESVVITVSCLKFRTLHALLLGFRLDDLKAVSARLMYNMSCHLIERQDSLCSSFDRTVKICQDTHFSCFDVLIGLIQTPHFPPIRYAVGWRGLSQEPTFFRVWLGLSQVPH